MELELEVELELSALELELELELDGMFELELELEVELELDMEIELELELAIELEMKFELELDRRELELLTLELEVLAMTEIDELLMAVELVLDVDATSDEFVCDETASDEDLEDSDDCIAELMLGELEKTDDEEEGPEDKELFEFSCPPPDPPHPAKWTSKQNKMQLSNRRFNLLIPLFAF